MIPSAMPPLEIWGGSECTVNRVGNQYRDQIRMTGHETRASDFDDLCSLGITRLRVPVLWERVFPGVSTQGAWAWSDACLGRCRANGVRPIVGLLHHGGGPPGTGLLDPAFPQKFASYASAVARRYPWVVDWTPINEPLTTARFSGLYGHWYPHHRADRSFVVALVHQIRAIGLAMQAIRDVVPKACLVQTEDIGCATSSQLLRYQRDYENSRRWWSLDLLHGNHSVRDVLEHMLRDDVATSACSVSCLTNRVSGRHRHQSSRNEQPPPR